MGKKMDRKLVAQRQPWEPRYLARKFRLTIRTTMRIIARVGRSRRAVNDAMRRRASHERKLRRYRRVWS